MDARIWCVYDKTQKCVCCDRCEEDFEAFYKETKNENSTLRKSLAAKDAEIARLKSEIKSKKNRINGLVLDVQHKNGRICDKQFETLRLEKQISRLKSALMTICTADKTAEGLREIAIDACNFNEEKQ